MSTRAVAFVLTTVVVVGGIATLGIAAEDATHPRADTFDQWFGAVFNSLGEPLIVALGGAVLVGALFILAAS